LTSSAEILTVSVSHENELSKKIGQARAVCNKRLEAAILDQKPFVIDGSRLACELVDEFDADLGFKTQLLHERSRGFELGIEGEGLAHRAAP